MKPTQRKALQFFTPFSVSAPQGDSWAKGHRSGYWDTTTPPPLATCIISSRSDDPSKISAAKLRRFCCRRDPQKHSKRHVSATHAATTRARSGRRKGKEINIHPRVVPSNFSVLPSGQRVRTLRHRLHCTVKAELQKSWRMQSVA